MENEYTPYGGGTPLPLLTAEDWVQNIRQFDAGLEYNNVPFSGYLDGVERSTYTLRQILENAKTFKELKRDLLKLVKQQEDFLADVSNRWVNNPNSYEEVGLPEIR